MIKTWSWATGWVLLGSLFVLTGHLMLALLAMAVAFGYMAKVGQPKPSTGHTAGSRGKAAAGTGLLGTSLDGDDGVVVLRMEDDDEE